MIEIISDYFTCNCFIIIGEIIILFYYYNYYYYFTDLVRVYIFTNLKNIHQISIPKCLAIIRYCTVQNFRGLKILQKIVVYYCRPPFWYYIRCYHILCISRPPFWHHIRCYRISWIRKNTKFIALKTFALYSTSRSIMYMCTCVCVHVFLRQQKFTVLHVYYTNMTRYLYTHTHIGLHVVCVCVQFQTSHCLTNNTQCSV